MSLANKYRPERFEDFVGQSGAKIVLSKMVSEGTVPNALIFEGPKGSGKTSMARVLAKSLVCQETDKPCNQCPMCEDVTKNKALAVYEIDGASNGLVDDIRRLQETLLFSFGTNRVLIIDEAQSISRAAFNALLKILEEPPPAVYFIFVTTESHRIPETVLSRCISFQFKKVDVDQIANRLTYVVVEEEIDAQEDLIDSLADRADGSVRTALMMLDQASRAGVSTAVAYEELNGEIDFAPVLLVRLTKGDLASAHDLVTDVLSHNSDPTWVQDQIVRTLRDVLILHSGGELGIKGTRLDQRKAAAGKINSVKAVAALRILWDAKTKIKAVEDMRLVTDMVLTLLADTLTEGGLQ